MITVILFVLTVIISLDVGIFGKDLILAGIIFIVGSGISTIIDRLTTIVQLLKR